MEKRKLGCCIENGRRVCPVYTTTRTICIDCESKNSDTDEELAKLACPHCSGEVLFSATGYYCTDCKKRIEPVPRITEEQGSNPCLHTENVLCKKQTVSAEICEACIGRPNMGAVEMVAQVRDDLLELGSDDLRECLKQIDHQIGMERLSDIKGLAKTIPENSDLNRKRHWAMTIIAECFGEYLHGTAEVEDCASGANFTMMGDILGDLVLYISNAE